MQGQQCQAGAQQCAGQHIAGVVQAQDDPRPGHQHRERQQDPGQRPDAHIFTASKAPWHDIADDLPQFAGWPGSEARVRATAADSDT